MTARTAVGLDISLTGTGVASSAGWCKRVGRKDITKEPLDLRLSHVDQLAGTILELVGRPTLVLVELPAYSRAGGGSWERAWLWYKVIRSLRHAAVPVAEVHNQQRMVYATGKGSATKSAVVDAVARRWPQFATGGDDNLADAAVMAAMGADRLGVPIGSVPASHRLALSRIAWPVEVYREAA